jgi:H+-translocating NAD(P) transhydrogenase subunit alpha
MARSTVAVPRETAPGERRVALTPDRVSALSDAGLDVVVEAGAGTAARFADGAYAQAGARTVARSDLCAADVLVAVGRPADDLVEMFHDGRCVIGMLDTLADPAYARRLARTGVTAVSLDGLPRTLSRAQEMDALTSQATVAGYKAVLVAASAYGSYFPLLVTAAGTARPARVLVLGAGVAGLQAIGTARRLGAVVAAHDIRPESRAEIESVGATFLDLGGPADATASGGYARALDVDEIAAQRAALADRLGRFDVVITTAQVPGGRPPLLVDDEAVKALAPGAVVVDLAAGPLGGNVAGTRAGETVVTAGDVTLIGAGNLPATVPTAASAAYARNVTALLRHLVHDGELVVDLTDEVQAGVVVTHRRRVVHPLVARRLEELP